MQRQPRIMREDLYLAPCAVTAPCALAQLSPCTLTAPGPSLMPYRWAFAPCALNLAQSRGSYVVTRTKRACWHWSLRGCMHHTRSLELCVVACAMHGHSSGVRLLALYTFTRAVRGCLRLHAHGAGHATRAGLCARPCRAWLLGLARSAPPGSPLRGRPCFAGTFGSKSRGLFGLRPSL